MTEGGKNNDAALGLLTEIHRLQLEHASSMGELRGEMAGCVEHLQQIDRRLELGSSQMRGYGTALEQHGAEIHTLREHVARMDKDCVRRHARVSDQFAALGRRMEDTDPRIEIAQIQAATSGRRQVWSDIAKAVAAVAAAAGIAIGLMKIERCEGSALTQSARDASSVPTAQRR